jgi:hypothetical protein
MQLINGERMAEIHVNGQIGYIPVRNVVTASNGYGGTLTDGTLELIDLLGEVFITFPNMHSATSWAETYDVSDRVNIAFHGTKLSDKWTVRYVF